MTAISTIKWTISVWVNRSPENKIGWVSIFGSLKNPPMMPEVANTSMQSESSCRKKRSVNNEAILNKNPSTKNTIGMCNSEVSNGSENGGMTVGIGFGNKSSPIRNRLKIYEANACFRAVETC